MHLSFEFEDFFRHKTGRGAENCDIKTPTFLLQSGVIGDLKIKDLPPSFLHDESIKLEVKLEGKQVTIADELFWQFIGLMKTEIDTSLNNRTEFRLTVEKKVSIY